MGKFNYKWHRGRYKPETVKKLPKLGVWVKVSDAADITGMSRSTIVKRYLTGAWDSVMHGGMIHVKLPLGTNITPGDIRSMREQEEGH